MRIPIAQRPKKLDRRRCRVRVDHYVDLKGSLCGRYEGVQSLEEFFIAQPLMIGLVHRPLKSASRFSVNAVRPSFASSEAKAR